LLAPYGSRLTISVTGTTSGHTRGSSIGSWGSLSAGGVNSPSPLSISHRRPLTVVTHLGSPSPSPSPRMHASQSFGAALSIRLPTGAAATGANDGKDGTAAGTGSSGTNTSSSASSLLSPPH
jgi:hypothetical protein